MKKLISYLYIKYVFLPELKRLQGETRIRYHVERVDPHWNRIEAALYEKSFSTLH